MQQETEDLRVRLRNGLKERFENVRKGKGMSQVNAVNELVAWFVEQDGRYQSHIMGQITLSAEELVMAIQAERGTASKARGTEAERTQQEGRKMV